MSPGLPCDSEVMGQTLAQIDYWHGQLEGIPSLLELPTSKMRPMEPSGKAFNMPFVMPGPLYSQIKSVATAQRASPTMILIAAFQVSLLPGLFLLFFRLHLAAFLVGLMQASLPMLFWICGLLFCEVDSLLALRHLCFCAVVNLFCPRRQGEQAAERSRAFRESVIDVVFRDLCFTCFPAYQTVKKQVVQSSAACRTSPRAPCRYYIFMSRTGNPQNCQQSHVCAPAEGVL